MRHRPVLLVTGFGPFPGQPENASAALAAAIADRAKPLLPGFSVVSATLPTEWQAGPTLLNGLLDDLQPRVAIHFGVSSKASGFVIETLARNQVVAKADAVGELPSSDLIRAHGPEALPPTWPAGLVLQRLRRLQLPALPSRDAGGYLCNAVLYHSLAHAAATGAGAATHSRRGFVHIPDRLVDGARASARSAGVSRLDWHGAVKGGLSILRLCATLPGRSG